MSWRCTVLYAVHQAATWWRIIGSKGPYPSKSRGSFDRIGTNACSLSWCDVQPVLTPYELEVALGEAEWKVRVRLTHRLYIQD
jgi:hypothetical protein